MGYGDELMATGIARGAAARGKRVAFGDGQGIIWGRHCAEVFRDNPNIAPPGSENDPDLVWIPHYEGNRRYNHRGGNGWIWHYDFRPEPGEVFFSEAELRFAKECGALGCVVIEPNVLREKPGASNKQWPLQRYQQVTIELQRLGYELAQFCYPGTTSNLPVKLIEAPSFRLALAALSRARLYVGPEGGLHHGAAAVGVPAVVIFGGFVPPEVTGYDFHVNLAAGGQACGSTSSCEHCRAAMDAITVDQVLGAALSELKRTHAYTSPSSQGSNVNARELSPTL